LPGPVLGQVRPDSPGGGSDPGRDVEQGRADGRAGGLGVEARGRGACSAGGVVGEGGRGEPGGVGVELPGGQVRGWPVLEVAEDLFDDRVLAVHRFGLVDDRRVGGMEGVVEAVTIWKRGPRTLVYPNEAPCFAGP
jgi:hypothetical protein